MAVLSASFLFGIVALFYLLSFVFFAIVRIATGISIQRIGYFSLRRIAYTPRDGIRVDLRGLALRFHRPTFAQPTYVSFRLTELKVTIDPNAIRGNHSGRRSNKKEHGWNHATRGPAASRVFADQRKEFVHDDTWKRLTQLKDAIKTLHGKIGWLSIFDIEIVDIKAVLPRIGEVQVGSMTAAIDTRRQTVDRNRLFRHKKEPEQNKQPAEWMFVIKGILFTPEGSQALDIMDICTLNVHGLLYKQVAGLRDVSISVKIGRINIPYDQIVDCRSSLYEERQSQQLMSQTSLKEGISSSDMMVEVEGPYSREESIVQTVSDSREFMASFLRGIQEIQLAVSFVGFTKRIEEVGPNGDVLHVNVSMNEIGVDLFRLDQKSPAHRMYFSPGDVAHQALIAAISLAVGLDDGIGKPDRLLYVPMTTSTIKTTLPSRTLSSRMAADAAERNANMLFANFAVTSPSVDVDLKHITVVLALFQRHQIKSNRPPSNPGERHRLISRLLPKANISFSVQEPVLRVVLPPSDRSLRGTDEYDLLISSISSISLDIDSSHSAGGELHYALTSTLRISSEELYYQTASGSRFNLLLVETFGIKVQLIAAPDISATISGNLDTISAHLVRPEIGKGIYRILQQVRLDPVAEHVAQHVQTNKSNFLRRLPYWIVYLQLRGSNFGIETAGTDDDTPKDLRGIALQLQSWTLEYKLQKSMSSRTFRPRSEVCGSMSPDESITNNPFVSVRRSVGISTDDRRLAVHIQGFEGFVVEGLDTWEPHSFVSIPRGEIAFSTASDNHGQMFHVYTHTKAVYILYSLYRHYAFGIAINVLQKAFAHKPSQTSASRTDIEEMSSMKPALSGQQSAKSQELITFDIRAPLIQIKATMPADPAMMIQIYGLNLARYRWATPFLKCHLFRLYAEAPRMKSIWARLVSFKSARIDWRRGTKLVGKERHDEQSFDIQIDFVRVAVPHQLIPHQVFENLTNIVKATEQLHHRLKTGTNDDVRGKTPEKPKKIPKISIRSRSLLFELEDSSFDWRLDLIYRVGLKEQQQRLAREEAYRIKVKRLVEQQNQKREQMRARPHPKKGRGRSRAQSANADPTDDTDLARSRGRRRSPAKRDQHSHHMRYDSDAGCMLSGDAKISANEAWANLQEFNASSWKRRISFAMNYQKTSMKDWRRNLWGDDDLPEEAEESEPILGLPSRPGLMSTLIHNFHIVIDKPSFPLEDYPKFLHSLGKGMPYHTQYSLLVPMNVQINMGESKVSLRNYPLPLIHVPALRSGQSARLPSWSLKTDFVVAEEFRTAESSRHVRVEIVSREKITDPPQIGGGFAIDVRRTVSAVKTYSNIDISVNTSNPTTFTWGTSYQPAIQDMMQTIESFTKPQADPSEKIGFWDKIRLSFHSRARITWKGDGDVHLRLKGTRDPYNITSFGEGFVWCFRQGVRWEIHQMDDPREFMTVTSGEYVWAVPDYSDMARYTDFSPKYDSDNIMHKKSGQVKQEFKKVVMKLSGRVRWLAGLVFERELPNGQRSFEFGKHYDVALKTPEAAQKYMPDYDAFREFRSQHIHLSIAVIAPIDRDWSVKNLKPSSGYNTVHLTPKFFTHFFDWWTTFQGSMQLPVRQGALFPGIEKSNKKFGRHLATIKYNLLLSPLFMAHVYKHKDADEYYDDLTRATGLKIRLDSFMLDLHQRRETFATQRKAKGKSGMTSGMKINQAQLDFVNADFRAVSSNIKSMSPETLKQATEDSLALLNMQSPPSPDTSCFTIPDNDFIWVDMDDFIELDWLLPAEHHPDVKIMPLAFSPRFTYFRQTEHKGTVAGNAMRKSQFGDEPTHFCVMSQDNDPRKVQRDLVRERIQILQEEIDEHEKEVEEHELKVVRDSARGGPTLRQDHEELLGQVHALHEKREFMERLVAELAQPNSTSRPRAPSSGAETVAASLSELVAEKDVKCGNQRENGLDPSITDYASDFNNRFTVHNLHLKWNNSLRDIILRYVHQVSQRRGFTYYMTRSAVKFILDILDEQQRKTKQPSARTSASEDATPKEGDSPTATLDNKSINDELQDRIEELMQDSHTFIAAENKSFESEASAAELHQDGKEKAIAAEFTAVDSYHVRVIAPQIQLQSEKNPKSVVLVTARGLQLKIIQIMDKRRLADDISGLVQRRFLVDMDGVQFFVTSQRSVAQYLGYYTHLRYGAPKGSVWPPWAPLEVNFDSRLSPFGWSRVVQETSIKLRYEKYNNLRLKYNNEVMKHDDSSQARAIDEVEDRMDHITVEFPHVRAICDSMQYYSMFLIVSDLLLYSEPLEKKHNERLEKIMLAADFSDLRGTPEMVESLQGRIHSLEEIRDHFQLYQGHLDNKGWQGRLAIERDLSVCREELFFMMKAITSSQRRYDGRSETENNGLMRWNISAYDIVWHLVREQNEPLAEFQLMKAVFNRTDNSDGSNNNSFEIGRIFGFNLLPEAIYPQMIMPYDGKGSEAALAGMNADDIVMLRVNWHMLEAIAGIPVLDNFEVNLFPLKIQLEREAGKKLFEYVFPPSNTNNIATNSPFLAKHRPPMQDDEDSDVDLAVPESPVSNESGSNEPDTRAGSMELRLRPTLTLGDMQKRPATSGSSRLKSSFFSSRKEEGTRTRGLKPEVGRERERSASRSRASVKSGSSRSSSKRPAADGLSITSRLTRDESSSNISTISSHGSERPNRFTLKRSNTTRTASGEKEKAKSNDDLTEMLSRASNYMTLAYVKISSVILCLSYKGRNERNFVDVHDFVFTMPTIEYRNKTWSNMDLVLRLKRDVIRALISHTGAIIGNKFSHHRPSKHQQSRLRELASSASLLPNTNINTLVRTATTFRHRSTDKARVEIDEEPLTQEQNSEESTDYPSTRGATENGTNGEAEMAPNGRTMSLTSPGTNGTLIRSVTSQDTSHGHVSDVSAMSKSISRPTTKEGPNEQGMQSPQNSRTRDPALAQDEGNIGSARRGRRATVFHLGKKMLSTVKQ